MELYPCPKCTDMFIELVDLYDHVLKFHSTDTLANTLRENMSKPLTKDDFTQIDSHWIYVINGFHLILAPDDDGNFKLTISGSVGPIPPATQYPTEPEWDIAVELLNKFVDAHGTASRRETG